MQNFGSHKLLIADIVGHEIRAAPRSLLASAAVMQGSRGGVDLRPQTSAGSRVAKYYAKMSEDPPGRVSTAAAVWIIEGLAHRGKRPRPTGDAGRR
jgi:hypothetical protein